MIAADDSRTRRFCPDRFGNNLARDGRRTRARTTTAVGQRWGVANHVGAEPEDIERLKRMLDEKTVENEP